MESEDDLQGFDVISAADQKLILDLLKRMWWEREKNKGKKGGRKKREKGGKWEEVRGEDGE